MAELGLTGLPGYKRKNQTSRSGLVPPFQTKDPKMHRDAICLWGPALCAQTVSRHTDGRVTPGLRAVHKNVKTHLSDTAARGDHVTPTSYRFMNTSRLYLQDRRGWVSPNSWRVFVPCGRRPCAWWGLKMPRLWRSPHSSPSESSRSLLSLPRCHSKAAQHHCFSISSRTIACKQNPVPGGIHPTNDILLVQWLKKKIYFFFKMFSTIVVSFWVFGRSTRGLFVEIENDLDSHVICTCSYSLPFGFVFHIFNGQITVPLSPTETRSWLVSCCQQQVCFKQSRSLSKPISCIHTLPFSNLLWAPAIIHNLSSQSSCSPTRSRCLRGRNG